MRNSDGGPASAMVFSAIWMGVSALAVLLLFSRVELLSRDTSDWLVLLALAWLVAWVVVGYRSLSGGTSFGRVGVSIVARLSAIVIYGCLVLSIVLLAANIAGFFVNTEITLASAHRSDAESVQISEEAFWQKIGRNADEGELDYITRATDLVSQRVIHISPEYTAPTIFENWVLWAHSVSPRGLWQGQWFDTRKSVQVGGGFCSQHALILDAVLRDANIESRIVGLEGHVLNESKVNGKWIAHDADYNVVYGRSIAELANQPDWVAALYGESGVPSEVANELGDIVTSIDDNAYYNGASSYVKAVVRRIEKESYVLIWLLPIVLLASGLVLRVISQPLRVRGGRFSRLF